MAQGVSGAYLGTFFHTPVYGQMEYLKDALIEVDKDGVITRVALPADADYAQLVAGYRQAGTLTELPAGCVGLPGFVDIHVHSCQWPQSALALDEPLYLWLQEKTFPLESKFADLDFARTVYADLVDQLFARGATTVVYLGSAHLEATVELARICVDKGQRALVGKTVMDDPEANPSYYRDASAASAVADTETLIHEVEGMQHDCPQGVWPVITPRFIPSCTDEVLKGLGDLAARYDCYVQTHCNEGQWEHDTVLARFGKEDPYALQDFGLLRDHSIMAHGCFLTPEEGELFERLGVAVAHCPMSNPYFGSSVAPVRRLREQGVRMGLGTDISGGYSPNLYESIRQAVMSSRQLETGVNALVPEAERGGVPDSRISVVQAFWLATKGGGEALGLPVGDFEPGMAFDLQVIDTKRRWSDLTGFGVFDEPQDQLARILYLSNPENIRQVYAQGRLVCNKDA